MVLKTIFRRFDSCLGHMDITTLSSSRSGHNFIVENIRSWFKGDFRHQNLENVLPERIEDYVVIGYKVIILRDFRNWLASFHIHLWDNVKLREGEYEMNMDRKVQAYWAIHNEADNPEYFTPRSIVYYDEFVDSAAYRQNLCRNLCGEYSEKKLNHVPANGRYSSFDGDEFQDRGSEMRVTERHRQILETEHKDQYLKLLERYGR